MDFPANNPEKPGYRLEFSDEFENTELDQSKWFSYMLPHWSTLEDSAARYKLENGSLNLLIEHDQQVWLANSDRASNLQTAHYSGAKGSQDGQFRYNPDFEVTADLPIVNHYTPQFGYFETRIKAVPVVGYHVALWMIGFAAEDAGEIRIFEIHQGNICLEIIHSRIKMAHQNAPSSMQCSSFNLHPNTFYALHRSWQGHCQYLKAQSHRFARRNHDWQYQVP